MMRRHGSDMVGAVLIAIVGAITSSCASVPGVPRAGDPCSGPVIVDVDGIATLLFSGSVVGRYADGTSQPVQAVQFVATRGSQDDLLPITIGRDGRFRGEVQAWSHSNMECREGRYVSNPTPPAATITVRASGCVEQMVVVDTSWHPRVIELTCELGRRK
jgi:hypothetical protein